MNRPILCISLLVLIFVRGGSAAADECLPWRSEFATRPGLHIGDIIIDNGDIFDPTVRKEHTLLHRLANALHIKTKKQVIAWQLLFHSGDPFDPRKLAESERLLRADDYIQSASIRPLRLCGRRVDIRVTTRDTWTLSPDFSFSRSGGNDSHGFEIDEHNLLGYGKHLVIGQKRDAERRTRLLTYEDPLLFGTRLRLSLSRQDNSDGGGHSFDLGLPFYSLDSRRAWGLHSSSLRGERPVLDAGEVVDHVHEDHSLQSLSYAWSRGLEDHHVERFNLGWTHERTRRRNGTEEMTRRRSYPWFRYDFLEDRYVKKSNFRTMGRIEDIPLGRRLSLGLGLLAERFGSDGDALRISANYTEGFELGTQDLGFLRANVTTEVGGSALGGESLSLQGDWYSFDEHGNDLFLSLRFDARNDHLPGEQILLGGDNGLRGYPTGFQTGDKALLGTLERRFHFRWYPLDIAQFGAVAFTDLGTAWGRGRGPALAWDAGLGLRVVPTRLSTSTVFHLDVAFPVTRRDGVDGVQFLVKTRKSF